MGSELGRGSVGAPKAVLCLWRACVLAAKTERSEPTKHPDPLQQPFPLRLLLGTPPRSPIYIDDNCVLKQKSLHGAGFFV